MKRFIVPTITLVILGLLVLTGRFVWQNFRGAAPALGPASGDIVAQLAPGENNTDMPLALPNGIGISVFAKDVANARVLRFDPNGTLLVSAPSTGKVFALPDSNGDGVADKNSVVVDGLNLPHGLAFHNGKLYIAETDAVAMYDYDLRNFKATNRKKIIDLPGGGNHFSRTIGFGPDGKLYISVGSTCNVCNEKDWRRAKILVANADGTGLREYATGLRNSVFFTWHPMTQDMWATDMGRDLLGDDIPKEEVNIVKNGGFYGWPYCYEQRVHDKNFDASQNAAQKCQTSIPPHIMFQAHSAPLGLGFIPDSWGQEYEGDLLVAYHGSWNRTTPTGYKMVRMKLSPDGVFESEEDFIAGWQGSANKPSGALGRPVDLLFDKKGVLFVSDDKAGVIYRLERQ